MDLLDFETSQWDNEELTELQSLANSKSISSITNDNVILDLMQTVIKEAENDFDEFTDTIINHISNNLASPKSSASISLFGIHCLQAFVQANWTGPDIDRELMNETYINFIDDKKLHVVCDNLLQCNGEDTYKLLHHPSLLWMANIILHDSLYTLSDHFKSQWLWIPKVISSHAHILEKDTQDLLDKLEDCYIEPTDTRKIESVPKPLMAEYFIECSHLFLRFYDYKKSEACLDKAKELLGIQILLGSALGKRTKFQEKDFAQLTLEISADEKRPINNNKPLRSELPVNLVLDQETLLPRIKFLDPQTTHNVELNTVDQAVVLSGCVQIQKTRPKDKLTPNEVMPYIDSVLQAPQSWSIQYKSLYLRCLIEFELTKKMERAMSQMEDLTKSTDKKTPTAWERFDHVHSIDLQPKWVTQSEWGNFLHGMGCVDSALEIFLKLQFWEYVIACYAGLGRHGKAEEVIRAQLEIEETANLYCHLGDACIDKQYYEKAWDFSKGKSSRAQRSLGTWHLNRKEYKECSEAFQKTLQLNPLQPHIWFNYGCSLIQEERLEEAVKAFQRNTSMEPRNAKGWSNLSSLFVRLGQLRNAYKAMEQATRTSYDSWQIWENFLFLSVDFGAFEDAINCVNRLIDLNRKTLDIQALQILVKAVLSDIPDFRELGASRLIPRMFRMFGHVTSQITNSPGIWDLYASLAMSKDTPEDMEKALHYMYKSHRCYLQNDSWEKTTDRVSELMRVTRKLIDVTNEVGNRLTNKVRVIQHYNSTKMSLTNLILRLKKAYIDPNTNELMPEIQTHVEELSKQVDDIANKININT